ncbi:hypothetical protein KKF34_08235 [Myxococcota bacterium]|nr:hypothetical protein [Myxococcota bacterium]MBU1381606.1 hypothetical protein [Myxococcota bacterium]MBU1496850.1 hypothetical protein [Myxococcota bacterium]
MPDFRSMGITDLLLAHPSLQTMFIFLLPTFAIFLFIVQWAESKKEDALKDNLAMLKTGLYIVEIMAVFYAVGGVFLLIDFIFSKMTSEPLNTSALKAGLGYIIGGAAVTIAMELAIVFLGTPEKNRLPRKLAFTSMLLIFAIVAAESMLRLLASITMFPKGAAFHVPLSGFLVYVPATFFAMLYYKAIFSSDNGPVTFLPGSFVNKANQMVEKSGVGSFGAAAVGGAAAAGMGGAPAASQPQQYSQPVAQAQPQQFSQPVAQAQPQQFSQPVAQAPAANACPTCGAAGRHIPQYSRYWCDTCQKYL